jgi:2-desacetyl-2-hydroxyethyl bacteriochlorophyllide A dehydrogenase
MKAISCNKPFELVNIDIENPIKKEGFALLKVKRIGICGTDLHAYEGSQPFFQYPRILGHELALEVIESNAFAKGELVTIIPYFNCNNCIACNNNKPNCCTNINVFGVHINGGMQEIISVPESALIAGNGLTLNELALVEPLAIGLHGVKRAAVKPNEFVLVIGAGPIGLGIIAMTTITGAQVIVLDINENRLQFCKEKLNVPHIINGSTDNIVEQLQKITNNNMPTVVIDATGNLKAINNAFAYMAHGARYVLVGLQKEHLSFSHPEFHKREATLMSSRNATKQDFNEVIEYMKLKTIDFNAFITHIVQFNEVVNDFKNWLNPNSGIIKLLIEVD